MNGDSIDEKSVKQNRKNNGFRLLTEFEWEAAAQGTQSCIFSEVMMHQICLDRR